MQISSRRNTELLNFLIATYMFVHCVRYIDVLSYHEKHFENELDVSLGPPSQVAHAASSVCMCTMTYGVQLNHILQRTDIQIQL